LAFTQHSESIVTHQNMPLFGVFTNNLTLPSPLIPFIHFAVVQEFFQDGFAGELLFVQVAQAHLVEEEIFFVYMQRCFIHFAFQLGYLDSDKHILHQ